MNVKSLCDYSEIRKREMDCFVEYWPSSWNICLIAFDVQLTIKFMRTINKTYRVSDNRFVALHLNIRK